MDPVNPPAIGQKLIVGKWVKKRYVIPIGRIVQKGFVNLAIKGIVGKPIVIIESVRHCDSESVRKPLKLRPSVLRIEKK